MAKKSMVARDNKRARTVKKYAKLRAEFKANRDYQGLASLPRNANPIRVRNRCSVTGRPRGYIRKFGLSRITFREYASKGQVPGVTKSSW